METQWKTEHNLWKFAENLIENRSKILKMSIYNSILIIALKPVTSLENVARVPLFVYIEVSTPYFLYVLVDGHLRHYDIAICRSNCI